MSDSEKQEDELSFYDYFVPLTNTKAFLFITFIGFFTYFNMLFNGFVWDDLTYVIRNANMHSIDILYSFGSNMFNSSGQYRPIPALYFSVLYTWFGSASVLFHLLQLILHITCASILFLVFQKFFSKEISFFLSAIFLVHPINVESVAFFAQTVSPLFFLLGISALFLSMNKRLSVNKLAVIFPLALLSILTKETGVLFLVLMLTYSLFYFRNNLIKLFVGSAIVFALYAPLRIFVGEVFLTIRYLVPIAGISLQERLLNLPMVMFYYLKTFFFPAELVIDQQWVITQPTFSNFYLPLIVDVTFLLLITLFGIYIWKQNIKLFKHYIFFFFWYFLGFLFISQIFPLDATVAERWFYFPMVGLLGMLGVFYLCISQRFKLKVPVVIVIVISILCLLSARTIIRNSNWHNVFILYHHDSAILDNFHIQNNLGFEYSQIKDYENAIKHYKRSIELRPYEGNLRNLGIVYMTIGDDQNAKKYLEQAYLNDSKNVYAPHKHDELTYQSLGAFMLLHEDPAKADQFLLNALADYPDYSTLWILYILNKTRLNDKQVALDAVEKARQAIPNNKNLETLYTKIFTDKPYTFSYAGKEYRFNER